MTVEAGQRPAPPPSAKGKTVEAPAAAADRRHEAAARRLRRRRWLSPLTRRILMLNLLALALAVAGLLYLGEYRRELVEQEFASLSIEGRLFAGALAESGVVADEEGVERLAAENARDTLRRLTAISLNRARLFASSGELLVDSTRLAGGQIEIQLLPPAPDGSLIETLAESIYDAVTGAMPGDARLPLYREVSNPRVPTYPEAARALAGEPARELRADGAGGLVLTVAVPVQRYRQVLGVLLLSGDGRAIEEAVRDVRFAMLQVFAVALAVSVLLSLYLAGTIARPIRRLAEAADRVRHGQRRGTAIPDFGGRRDEIGDLAGSLRDMTEALWARMDAIESFAADVAHEIKNPLTSLRSAVETAARIEDPQQQKKLMAIVLDDVQRLDRLISDISAASRLDAELSRAESEPVDIARMLRTLGEIDETTRGPDEPRLVLDLAIHQSLVVPGIESRLAQVLRNLIANAVSFSPPGAEIRVSAARDGRDVRVVVSDEGPGLPEGKLEAIFDRFYTERPAGEKFGTHSGLGLSISKQVVEAHGGTILATNRRDADGRVVGAQFVVTLPVAN